MSKHKTVLQLIESSGPGGAETVIIELCNRLDRSSYKSIVALLHDGWLNQELTHNSIKTFIINNKRPYDISLLMKIIHIIIEYKVHIVHSHEFTMNIYGAIAALLTGRRNIATIHGKNYYLDKVHRKYAYNMISRFPTTRITTVSEESKRFIAHHINIATENISVIYNGVDIKKFSYNDNKLSYNDEYLINNSLQINKPIIGTVGNIYPIKGHIYLLKAARSVIDEFCSATFVIIGKPTDYLNFLKLEVTKLGLDNHVIFLGFRDDISNLLPMMDIFILPSIQETFSIATIEAMAASRPVIVTRSGGPEEIVIDGVNGLLIPPEDSNALSQKILYLLRNKAFAKYMGESARNHIKKNFTIDAMTSNYQKLYQGCPLLR